MAEATSVDARRYVLFKGHKDQAKSAMVTQLARDYETFTGLLRGESATRTLMNLCNLHAVRGRLDRDGKLVVASSMSGPHHYLGWLDPTQTLTVEEADADDRQTARLLYRYVPPAAKKKEDPQPEMGPVPSDCIARITSWTWLRGATLDPAVRLKYAVHDEVWRGERENEKMWRSFFLLLLF
jgi:hypothetical protein